MRKFDAEWTFRAAFKKWWTGWLSGGPHFIVGRKEEPYLLRWFVIPRNPWMSIYIHKFLRDDEDRALHDHPWWFVSLMLKGGYEEIVSESLLVWFGELMPLSIHRGWLSLAIRKATHRHRVRLRRGPSGEMLSCWTLVITGPRIREWGFWCPKGFVPWQVFTNPKDYGEVGRGCD